MGVWLVLAYELETRVDKFYIECKQLTGSKPLLLLNDSAKSVDKQKLLRDNWSQ